jgi:hypothetical protein
MQSERMNERIRELAEQAGLNAPYGSDHEGLRDFDYKKFAELIVRECAGVGYDASYYECAMNVSNKILEHFGVKK